jgi:NTE family protein
VLSGGGAYGSVQVGMLRALTDAGIRPDLIVGASVGSLNGALVASRPDDGVDRLMELWGVMSRREVFGHGRVGAIRNLFRSGVLSRFDGLEALIDRYLDVDDFESLPVPLAAVATDAVTGEPELLSTGPLKPALLASSAVPGVFPRVDLDGRIYIDGGVSANLPIRQAIAFGARSVVALDASPAVPAGPPARILPGLLHSVTLIVRNQRSHAVDELAGRYPILVLPQVTPPDLGSFNFGHTAELIERSYEVTQRAVETWSPTPVAWKS